MSIISQPVPESVLPEATGPDAMLVVVTSNVIAATIAAIAGIVELPVVVVDQADGPALDQLGALGLTARHAVVLTDHDAPDVAAIIRTVLDGPAGYLGMMGSRSRSAHLFETLRAEGAEGAEGADEQALGRLHVPVGLDLGGSRTAGLIALSVVSEVTAWANGRLTREGDRSGLEHQGLRTP
ncbi:XdhC family protein [Lapillicoccus sp.]|uniref:XdhC family protein n=1 Tax=Lapillicoccus sp. TaxID=1909287 RepID=UPI0025EB53EB|nr:XdhC family protein [Lapillicoccus sp.]